MWGKWPTNMTGAWEVSSSALAIAGSSCGAKPVMRRTPSSGTR